MNDLTNIRLKRDVIFSDIEKLAFQIIDKKPTKMQIPNRLSYSGGFGMEGAVLQLLATWFREAKNHTLHTSIQNLSQDSFEDLCNNLFGLCALRLSDNILLADKSSVDLSTALKPAIPIFHNLRQENFKSAFKGMYLTIPSIKSPIIKGGKDREFDNPLYINDIVAGSQRFNQITLNALNAIINNSSKIDRSLTSNLSEILRELYSNTHRHARTDVNGNPLRKNFRGIIFNSISLSGERLNKISRSGGGDLALFISDWLPIAKKSFRAIDITVVDSGPGYARRWQNLDKDQLNIELEKEAIIQCFTKHRSTDTADSSGSGLSNVLSDLRTLKGWFRLRTGRTLVEKSFFNQEGSNTIEEKNIKEMDSFMEGVVFNIVIPLQSIQGVS